MVTKLEKLNISSDLNHVEEAEAFIRKLFSNLTEELYNRIQLAVNEAVMNAILHGNHQDSTKTVAISAKKQSNHIEVSVKDQGAGFNPDIIPDPTDENRLLKTSGRGVFLIKQLADEVSFKKGGTLVKMIFRE